MLDQNAILDANDVRRNPVHRETKVRKSSVHDDEVSFRHNRCGLIFESRRKILDEIEQALAARLDVRAVLNVVRGPETLSGYIIALVEECVERFHDEGFVLFGCSLRHVDSFLSI